MLDLTPWVELGVFVSALKTILCVPVFPTRLETRNQQINYLKYNRKYNYCYKYMLFLLIKNISIKIYIRFGSSYYCTPTAFRSFGVARQTFSLPKKEKHQSSPTRPISSFATRRGLVMEAIGT